MVLRAFFRASAPAARLTAAFRLIAQAVREDDRCTCGRCDSAVRAL